MYIIWIYIPQFYGSITCSIFFTWIHNGNGFPLLVPPKQLWTTYIYKWFCFLRFYKWHIKFQSISHLFYLTAPFLMVKSHVKQSNLIHWISSVKDHEFHDCSLVKSTKIRREIRVSPGSPTSAAPEPAPRPWSPKPPGAHPHVLPVCIFVLIIYYKCIIIHIYIYSALLKMYDTHIYIYIYLRI